MAKYITDPKWINVKCDGSCVRCKNSSSVEAVAKPNSPRRAKKLPSGVFVQGPTGAGPLEEF
jgi:hypothetical protein